MNRLTIAATLFSTTSPRLSYGTASLPPLTRVFTGGYSINSRSNAVPFAENLYKAVYARYTFETSDL